MLLESMRASRKKPHIALISYNTIRGKNPGKPIFVFEGFEDAPYYETIINRIRNDISFSPLVAKGKDQVLGLRELLEKREDRDIKIRYFIDKDFDGTKGFKESEELYVTDGYSIENHIVSKEALNSILLSEFKCCPGEDHETLEKIKEDFDTVLDQFFENTHTANHAIYHARINSIKLENIENRISEYITVTPWQISLTGKDHFELIGWPAGTPRDLSSSRTAFDKLNPQMEWRGKFIYSLFIKILKSLKDDRTSEHPKHFSKKSGIKYDPNGELVRALSSLSKVPESLETFIKACPT